MKTKLLLLFAIFFMSHKISYAAEEDQEIIEQSEQLNFEKLTRLINNLEKDNEIEIALLILMSLDGRKNPDARIPFSIAKLLKKTKKLDEALTYLQKAHEIDPDNYDVLFTMSEIYRTKQKFDEAENILASITSNEAIVKVKILSERAAILNAKHQYEEACTLYETLLKSLPNNSMILHNYAYTLRALGRLPEAIFFYEKAAIESKNSETTLFAKALTELANGNLKDGFAGYELRRKHLKTVAERLFTHTPQWNGKDSLIGKIILVFGEQGLGDTFQFVRYAYALKKCGAYVIVAVQDRLKDIIKLCPYIDEVIGLKDTAPDHDFHAPLMSLPSIFGTTVGSIPCGERAYLYADEELVSYWKEQLAKNENIKIGICFQGSGQLMNPFGGTITSRRSIPVSLLVESLAAIPGVTLYCLQQLVGLEELTDEMRQRIVVFDEDFDKKHGAFMDTAAVMNNLDLVITVDTSIAHLAGGLQIRTFILLPKVADWRWMVARNDSPWYETVTLFRQSEYNNWESVIEQLMHAVTAFVKEKRTHG